MNDEMLRAPEADDHDPAVVAADDTGMIRGAQTIVEASLIDPLATPDEL